MLHDIRPDLVHGHTGYDVTSYFRSAFIEVRKAVENAASDGFGSSFSGVAFWLPYQMVSILSSYFAGSKGVSVRLTRIRCQNITALEATASSSGNDLGSGWLTAPGCR